MKRIVCVFLSACILLFCVGPQASAQQVSVSAGSYVLYCADNGKVLCGENQHTRAGMASTTKIMTALIALEYASTADEVVEFTEDMIAEGSSMYLKVGDKLHLSDLAAGMMTVSGNDAANAVALAIGGSMEGFAEIMNRRAKQLGMENTNFVTPSGLDAQEHYSTPYDMALLMAHAMSNDDFAQLTEKTSVSVEFVNPQGQKVTYTNHNKLLSMYSSCVGGKTGYTKSTGRCLVTCARQNGMTLVAVTFNDREDWQDHISLYEYGFGNFSPVDSAASDSTYTVSVLGSRRNTLTAKAQVTQRCIVEADKAQSVICQVYLPPVVYAPVKKGDTLGKVVYSLDGEIIQEIPLIAGESAAYMESAPLTRLWRRIFG
ncbi:MAG: D-alanyl-D-alanine carboxypeptidase [Ruminococcus sp.]|nr:D-alanyl-D-alanine carboxypeptidase [Ruminococcus sp.]